MGIERADAHLHSVQAGVRFINQSRPGTGRSVSAWLRCLWNWQHFPQLRAQFSELDAQPQHLPFGGMSDAGNAVDLSVDLFEAGRDFRLELIESRLESIESRLEWIELRLKVIESCLKVIESCVKVIESSIESIESSLKLIAPALGSLVEFLDSLKDSRNGGLRGHFVSHYFMPSRKE